VKGPVQFSKQNAFLKLRYYEKATKFEKKNHFNQDHAAAASSHSRSWSCWTASDLFQEDDNQGCTGETASLSGVAGQAFWQNSCFHLVHSVKTSPFFQIFVAFSEKLDFNLFMQVSQK